MLWNMYKGTFRSIEVTQIGGLAPLCVVFASRRLLPVEYLSNAGDAPGFQDSDSVNTGRI